MQFQSVLETFSPHDTVFSLTSASELTDSALGRSTMLLPSAASLASSNSSLRRRKLDGITEDAEDVPSSTEAKVTERAPSDEEPTATYGRRELDELPASAVLAKALLAKRREETLTATADTQPDSVKKETPEPSRKDSLVPIAPALSEPPSLDKSLPATPEPTPPTTDDNESAEPLTSRPHTHHLSVAESDSISQWSNNVASYATVKPKKKLGPRPHVEAAHRPKTSGTTDVDVKVRPVANLPNSVRVSTRSVLGTSLLRPGSQHSTQSVPVRFAPSSHSNQAPPPLPSSIRLQTAYRSSESRPTLSRAASATTEASTTTPEKLRLMKALQLRKRNMLLAQRASPATSHPTPNAHTHGGSGSSVSTFGSSSHLSSDPSQEHLSSIDEESKITQSSTTTSPTFTTNLSEDPSTKASSFAEQDETPQRRRSLSSATSSSITPKPVLPESHDIANSTNIAANGSSARLVEPELPIPADNQPFGTTTGPRPDVVERSFERDALPHGTTQLNGEDGANRETVQPALKFVTNGAAAPLPTSEVTSKIRRLPPSHQLSILPGGETSASDVSDDESLMEELQNATVHEAKPVSVARSPVTPTIMSRGSSDKLREMVSKTSKTNQQPRGSAGGTPDGKRSGSRSGSIRSVSTALPQWPPAQAGRVPVPLTTKPTLGTGISKRIKALEVLTTKDANSQPPPHPVREASGARAGFSAFLKRSAFLPTQQAPNTSTETAPPKQLPSTTYQQNSDSSNMAPAGQRRPSEENRGSAQRGDTISVTARIVRDTNTKRPPMSPSSSYHAPLNLFRSPLIVEHEKYDEPSQDPSFASMDSITKSPSKSDRGRFSFSSHRSASQTNLPRSESNTSKVSQASAHKKHGPPSASDAASVCEEKAKGSRTSRLMKRMSNLTSPRNKRSHSKEPARASTIQEQSELSRHNSISESPMHVVDIGDVNVQFPESLLWKRRFMRVDDHGYLIFSPPRTDANMRSVSRKYHLSDFIRPSLPDREREEMAWSIILDFKDGRYIQCACEGRHAQEQVLRSE